MSRRTPKRQSDSVGLTLTPIVQVYLERIEWALTYGSDIVVFSDEPGAEDHNYVRRVEDHPRPKTLQIGPASIQEVDELVAYIRGRIDFSGNATVNREAFEDAVCLYPPPAVVRS
jgi:hypothetical protein